MGLVLRVFSRCLNGSTVNLARRLAGSSKFGFEEPPTKRIWRRTKPRKAELDALPDLPRDELKERWQELYGTCPPKMSRRILRYAIAYRLQENAYGGLDKKTRRREGRREPGRGKPVVPEGPKVKPGTRLLREWHGARGDRPRERRPVPRRDLAVALGGAVTALVGSALLRAEGSGPRTRRREVPALTPV